ncbi:MAG TPA: hypothetical protein VNX68_16520 [Nitrosopumilaceae archaeon]|jgi:hypothetical protein|nr:hypothetical protein [Nitrosopumilaceae archaeon]
MEYEVGNRVVNLKNGKTGTVRCSKNGAVEVFYDDCTTGSCKGHPEKYYKLIACDKKNNVMGKIMDIQKSFVMAFLAEPEKSYRKAGITNGDGILTDCGVKIFLTYLLKNTPAFKTDVVDGILTDMKDEKGC